MNARIWSTELASAVMVSALACINTGGAQAPDQNDTSNRPPLKRASKTTSKPGKLQPIYLTPKVAEILRLTKSGISDDVVLAFIEKSPADYLVTSRQLISLRDAGVSEPVLKVLAEHRSPTPDELAGASSAQSFYQGLNTYGRWFYLPGYGWCWQPISDTAGPFSEPYGADMFSVPPMYSSVIVGNGGFGFPNGGFDHVEHHGHGTNNQHSAQHNRRPADPAAGRMARPSSGTPQLARVSNVPFGVLGASTQTMSQSPYAPVGSSWSGGRPSELAANIPYYPLGAGTLGFGQLGGGGLGIGGSMRGNLSPYGIAGMPLVANNGANPYLPVGGTPASGTLPPYSIAGMPFTPSSGANPWLPVGGTPASGSLPPYLPVGGTPANGSLPPYGVVMHPSGYPMSQFQQPGFQFLQPSFEFLQPSFHFLQPSFSFLPNTGTLAPGPVTSPAMSPYAFNTFHGGWGGGFIGGSGFHGGGGGFHGGGGGGGGGHR